MTEAVRSGVKSHPAAAAPPRDISEDMAERRRVAAVIVGRDCNSACVVE